MLSDKFRVFTAVCECGGLTKAGEKLFVAQTRGERDRLYNALRDDQNVRKKVFESGQRRFYCYHIGDVEKYIENMKID